MALYGSSPPCILHMLCILRSSFVQMIWIIDINGDVDVDCVVISNTLLYRQLCYGVATVSRIDKIIGLFCRTASLLQGSFAKETYNFIDPINRSHSVHVSCAYCGLLQKLYMWMIWIIDINVDVDADCVVISHTLLYRQLCYLYLAHVVYCFGGRMCGWYRLQIYMQMSMTRHMHVFQCKYTFIYEYTTQDIHVYVG